MFGIPSHALVTGDGMGNKKASPIPAKMHIESEDNPLGRNIQQHSTSPQNLKIWMVPKAQVGPNILQRYPTIMHLMRTASYRSHPTCGIEQKGLANKFGCIQHLLLGVPLKLVAVDCSNDFSPICGS